VELVSGRGVVDATEGVRLRIVPPAVLGASLSNLFLSLLLRELSDKRRTAMRRHTASLRQTDRKSWPNRNTNTVAVDRVDIGNSTLSK
jgi:hypothetical protein